MKKLDKFTSSTTPKRKLKVGDMTAMPGGRKAIFVREEDASGQLSEHFRIVDTLGTMLRRGTITTPMFDAGTRFAEDFHSAGLEGIRAIDYGSAGGGSASTDSMTERVAMAQHRVGKALDAVGGIESLGGSLLWHVVGQGMSLREWIQKQFGIEEFLNGKKHRGLSSLSYKRYLCITAMNLQHLAVIKELIHVQKKH
ncbi:MAG: hypothetical protein RR365_15485 [Bacteroides sp.]